MDHLLGELAKAEDEVSSEDSLKRISELAERFKMQKAVVAEQEAALKESKAVFNKLSQELIPNSMLAVGMSSLALANGEKVTITEELSVSIKDYDKLNDFLEERGDSSLMKLTLEIGKVPQDILFKIVQMLSEKFGILATPKLFLHPMTLKKYVKELCGIGNSTGEGEMPLSAIDEEMLKTYLFYKTTIK